MNSADIKKEVRKFRRRYSLDSVTYDSLRTIFERQGFTIIEFNPAVNDPDVDMVIRSLGLSDMILRSKGFLYADKTYRLLFVSEKLSEEEKMLVLAHEEGHYSCGHTVRPGILGQDVKDEFEANEFAHYLMKDPLRNRIRRFAVRFRRQILAGGIAVIFAGAVGIGLKQYHDRKLYEGEYYVTQNGTKYHRADCITIQDSDVRRLTKEDVKSGQYEACEVCGPQ